jgi:hypothetical protein
MTIVFSIISLDLIVMAVDSAVMQDFGDKREYTTGRKAYFYPGVGCVTTWGTRNGNRIGDYLENKDVTPEHCSVENLADLAFEYLSKKYRPGEMGFDDIGYHIGGFDTQGRARLFHAFWGFDRPKPPEQINRKYEKYDHSPQPSEIQFLYNGRNDLAQVVVNAFLDQHENRSDTRFQLNNPTSIVCFADFVVRFGAELTPEVGPPFLTYLISPRNESAKIKNDNLCPVNPVTVAGELCRLGYHE